MAKRPKQDRKAGKPTTPAAKQKPAAKPAKQPKPTTKPKPTKKPSSSSPPREAFSPQKPLRIYIGGDSLVITPGYSLLRAMGVSKVYKAIDAQPDGIVSSGLERPDFYNWFERIKQVVQEDRPDVVVVAFGANDDHSYMTGLPANVSVGEFASAAWVKEYRRRVAGYMDTVIRGGGYLVWIGLPITSSESQSQRYEIINRIAFQEAKKRPKAAVYVDTYLLFADPRPAAMPSTSPARTARSSTSARPTASISSDRRRQDREGDPEGAERAVRPPSWKRKQAREE